MSDSSSPGESPDHTKHVRVQSPPPNGTKRKQDAAGLRANKAVKRRASKACQSCRARKVRCNVVEQIPCTNCRLDEVECLVSESKRKKLVISQNQQRASANSCRKWKPEEEHDHSLHEVSQLDSPTYDPFGHMSTDGHSHGHGSISFPQSGAPEHRPHTLCKQADRLHAGLD